ncbi:MAG: GNAT family N-acetyltransferase [Bacteroidota bacterium]
MTDRLALRAVRPSDDAFLREALYHAIHVPPGALPPPRSIVQHPDIAHYLPEWTTEADGLGTLAEWDGRPVAAAWLRVWTGTSRGYGFVARDIPELTMAVLPGHQGHGIGTALLRRVLDDAEAVAPGVSLSVSLTNPARRLYEREGFERVGDADAGGSITMVHSFAG